MKKLLSLLLCVLLVCAASAAFADYKAGDTVTVSVSVSNPNDACAFDVGFSYDKSALQFVSASGASGVAGGPNGFFFAAMSPFSGGSIGTATFKVTSNAVPGKTYTISCYNMGAYDFDDNEVSIGISTSGGSVTIASAGCTSHVWNDGEVTTKPTCAKEGVRTYTCTNSGCGETKTESIPKLTTHTWDHGNVTTKPTCTKDGVKTYTCSVCKDMKTEAVTATGHDSGKWITVNQPACTETGTKELQCTVCGEVLDTETLPAAGHDDGEWIITKPATCKADGIKELQCTICGDTLDSEVIPAADAEHVPGKMALTTPATCTDEGERTQACTVCGEVLMREAVPAEGHDDGRWITVTPATKEETGLKELHCTKCDELLDSAEIPVKTTDYYVNNTVCSIGPRFRDESELTNNWYRFTPVNLSENGVQTFDLIASDTYIIGEVTITVADGMVTINYAYVSDNVKEHSAFCTLLPSLADITTLEPEQLRNYPFGTPISIADDLNGDVKMLLFICNVVDYHSDLPITHVYTNTDDFVNKINALKENMD